MNSEINLNEIVAQFAVDAKIQPYGNGHINDTYLTEGKKYILQRINTNVFKNPVETMDNIEHITSFLRKKIEADGGDADRQTLTVIQTKDGKNAYTYDENNVFRMYYFITDSKTVEENPTDEELFYAGKGFGKFQKYLDDYPAEDLFETIEKFHHTPNRVENLKKAILEDKAGRAQSVQAEIAFALECASFASVVVDGLENGSIPLRVTHNDTKINNILFDEETGEDLCVIDLDTVMPGSALYDFGDALRIGASTAAEDETDLDKVHFSAEKFEVFAKGYLSQMKPYLTETELKLLPFSAKLITYEVGIRFLTDYLDGDVYFKTAYDQHNLDRARNQFKLVKEIAQMEDKLHGIIEKL